MSPARIHITGYRTIDNYGSQPDSLLNTETYDFDTYLDLTNYEPNGYITYTGNDIGYSYITIAIDDAQHSDGIWSGTVACLVSGRDYTAGDNGVFEDSPGNTYIEIYGSNNSPVGTTTFVKEPDFENGVFSRITEYIIVTEA